MKKNTEKILVNCENNITRLVLIKNKKIEYLFVDKNENAPVVGNIYKGKITRIIAGLNAVFVDIGEIKNGFLPLESPAEIYVDEILWEKNSNIINKFPSYKIGEEIIVQVTKPGTEIKGVKLTTHISLPGRLMVLLPFSSQQSVSRKIRSIKEKKRLLRIFEKIIPKNMGFIIRTACEEQAESLILKEAKFLINLWSRIRRKTKRVTSPAILWEEIKLPEKFLRDYAGKNIEEILIDNDKNFKKTRMYTKSFIPEILPKIKLYRKKIPLFINFQAEEQIKKFLKNRIKLPSRGHIIIEEGETLTAIDVNTGSSEKRNAKETIFNTNMEAAKEIPRQIRVRNLSGLIIIDFIDMKDEKQRKKIFEVLDKYIEQDKARIKILSISKLGLAEMSREKVEMSLNQILMEKCEHCGGAGRVESMETLAIELKNQIFLELANDHNGKLKITLNEELFNFVKSVIFLNLNFRNRRRVFFKPSSNLEREEFHISKI